MILHADSLSGGYQSILAVKDVSFAIDSPSILAILGTNGAGKSTLLRMLIGLTPIVHGRLFLADQEITHVAPERRVRRGIGYVPEQRRLFHGMTVKENLEVACSLPPSARSRAIDDVLGLFPALSRRFYAYGWSLSGGEQQMTLIARALMTQPKILLLDEPTFGLSPAVIDVILTTLPEIVAGGTALIIATENPRLMSRLSPWVLLLNLGRAVFYGPLTELPVS